MDQFAQRIVTILERAGLPRAVDGGEPGGFLVKARPDEVFLVWKPARVMWREAYEEFTAGRPGGEAARRYGAASVLMANAIAEILKVNGVSAVTNQDGLEPGTVFCRA